MATLGFKSVLLTERDPKFQAERLSDLLQKGQGMPVVVSVFDARNN
jgi:hypothetical protein